MSLGNKQKNTHSDAGILADDKARLNRTPNGKTWEDTFAMGEVKT